MIPKCTPYLRQDGLVSRLAAQADGSRVVEPPSNSVEDRRLGKKLPVTSVRKLTSPGNCLDDCCSSSKLSMERASSSMRAGSRDTGECSSSACFWDLPGSPSSSLDFLGGDDTRFDMPCKVCGVKGSPLRMLICDLCDEAFHFACCKARRLPEDEWYCRPCLRKKPKVLPETLSGQLFYIMSQKRKRRILREKLGPILSMLVDGDPYASGVRIGKKFQAEVPNGPARSLSMLKFQSPGDDYLAKASELDPAEWGSLNARSFSGSPRQCSIGNWLQCREMVYNEADENDEGTICGKWRRAPLFEAQTEDWDCSCALLWDPIHADCAVPQELETTQVLKHLKYVQLLKTRLVDKRGANSDIFDEPNVPRMLIHIGIYIEIYA
ncbi:unnamed protein product [Spirodela intermedia]|uniref:Uncharacterized protein n=1 Tax=Spirodela intermedia TaxID=51605 RepID=A0A7I8JLX2_SPIIN|nr:unnamed protein product [Spirodela intermedia]CAA6671144.1 unnamed protein product [Spirodela intermedia]